MDALDALVSRSLALWPVPENAAACRINVAENITYLVEGDGAKTVLRVHRRGYHTKQAIESELAWSEALSSQGDVLTPSVIRGKNGEAVQRVGDRHAVMFAFIPGDQPSENSDLSASFEQLGAIAARAHRHSTGWQRPSTFERMAWNENALLGQDAIWGDWRDAPNVTPEVRTILERVEDCLIKRLQSFGKAADRYGVIHADMRLANLLVYGGTTRLIDFDDCGFGWFLYDFAAAVSFIEDSPQIPMLRDAWVRGYRTVRDLPETDVSELDSFVMLRRLALLAWIGSRIEAPEPQHYAPHFARVSAELGEVYLSRFG